MSTWVPETPWTIESVYSSGDGSQLYIALVESSGSTSDEEQADRNTGLVILASEIHSPLSKVLDLGNLAIIGTLASAQQ